MQSSIDEAKKRLLSNVTTNFLAIFVGGVAGIWLTPYLIRNLTIEVYGIIPLSMSLVVYFRLLTNSIANAVSRFVAIHLGKGEIEQSNVYFNSALIVLVSLCGMLLPAVVILSLFFSKIFRTPTGYETDVGWLFFYVMLTSFITAITSPFMVSTLVTHRFDLRNIVKVLSQILRIVVIVVCFTYLSVSLVYVGLSYLAMALMIFFCSVAITKKLTPQLQINFNMFKWTAAYEMGRMSIWMVIHQLGALLYLNISFVVINLFLGPKQCGRYAPVAQLVTLLALFGVALTNLFTPLAYDHISKNNLKVLVKQLTRIIKFLGLVIALPVGLLCGLSVPILQRWLGGSFVDLWPLVLLLIIPWQIGISIRPTFSVFEGFNKVKIPAIATLIGGVMNLLMSIFLIKFTSLGIFGVGLALCLCWTGENMFFTPVYTAIIIGQTKTKYAKELFSGMTMALLLGLGAFGLTCIFDLATIPRLLAAMVSLTAVYALFCYTIVLNKEERVSLLSMIVRKKVV